MPTGCLKGRKAKRQLWYGDIGRWPRNLNSDFLDAGASGTAIDFDLNGELTNVRNGEDFDVALTGLAAPFGTDADTLAIIASGTAQSTTSTASFTTSGAAVLDR